jgi:hypothetical protein
MYCYPRNGISKLIFIQKLNSVLISYTSSYVKFGGFVAGVGKGAEYVILCKSIMCLMRFGRFSFDFFTLCHCVLIVVKEIRTILILYGKKGIFYRIYCIPPAK